MPAHCAPLPYAFRHGVTARACAAVGRFERLTITLAAWKGTAEAYAGPAIAVNGSDLAYLSPPSDVATYSAV